MAYLLAEGTSVDWVTLLQTFGLAVTILFAVGLGFWRAAAWSAREIILPFRDRFVNEMASFLRKIETTIGKLDVNVDKVTDNLEQQTRALEGLERLSIQHGSDSKLVIDQASRKEEKIDSLVLGQREIRSEVLAEIKEAKAMIMETKATLLAKLKDSSGERKAVPKKEGTA